MADPVNERRPPLAFDLAQAIADARAEFPEQTAGFTFVDLSAADARDRLKDWMERTDPVFREKYFENSTLEGWQDRATSVGGFVVRDSRSGKTLISVRSEIGQPFPPFGDTGRGLAYIFSHELGHALVEGGVPAEMLAMKFHSHSEDVMEVLASINLAETAADTFAVLYAIKKGWMELDDVQGIAASNAEPAGYWADFSHFTTIALEQLILTKGDVDFISLPSQEICAIAAAHAKEFSVDARGVDLSMRALAPVEVSVRQEKEMRDDEAEPQDSVDVTAPKHKLEDRLKRLADIYLSGPPAPGDNAIPYFIARRVLSDTFETGKMRRIQHEVALSGPYWDSVRQVMSERAREENISALLGMVASNKRDITTVQSPEPLMQLRIGSPAIVPR